MALTMDDMGEAPEGMSLPTPADQAVANLQRAITGVKEQDMSGYIVELFEASVELKKIINSTEVV